MRGLEKQPRSKFSIADFLIGVLAILLCLEVMAWMVGIQIALRGNADFRQLYAAGYMVRAGQRHQLYDYEAQKRVQDALVSQEDLALQFIRPAYQALLFVPLSLFSFRIAYFVFLAINVGLLVVCLRMLRPWTTNLAAIAKRFPAGIFLACFPLSVALMQGQDSIILLLLLTGALVALHQGREGPAGAFVGLGLFKFQIALPIGLFFLLWRRWKFSAGFMLAAASMAVLSIVLIGIGETWSFVQSLLSVGTGMLQADHPSVELRVLMMGNLRGLAAGLAGRFLPPLWVQAVTVAASLLVIVWIGFFVKPKPAGIDAFILAITASTVVSYYLFIHDLSVMLVPIIVCLNRYITADAYKDRFGSAVAIACIVLYIGPASLFVSADHVYLVAVPLITLLFLLVSSSKRPDRAIAL